MTKKYFVLLSGWFQVFAWYAWLVGRGAFGCNGFFFFFTSQGTMIAQDFGNM